MVSYKAPWNAPDVIDDASVDLIFSQAVLEHVDDLQGVYAAMRKWLKPDGIMTHQIDFKCHGKANAWNGHWTYSDFVWRGNRRPPIVPAEPAAALASRQVDRTKRFSDSDDTVYRSDPNCAGSSCAEDSAICRRTI